MKKIYVILSMLLLLGLVSCTDNKEGTSKINTTIIDPIITEKAVIIKEFEMDSFTNIVDGKYFPEFSLKNIEVNEGDTVRLKINTTKGVHDITLDEFNVFAETPEGEVTIVEFIASKKGTFEYYCSKPNHRKNGHWGTIVVK